MGLLSGDVSTPCLDPRQGMTGIQGGTVGTRRVLILGIDTFARKNVSQIVALNEQGYTFVVATKDLRGTSAENFAQVGSGNQLVRLVGNAPSVLMRVANLLRESYNHVELYAAGRMALAYLPLLRMFGQRVVVVERGDIGLLSKYDRLTQMAVRLAYRRAGTVWYKEPYMARLLAPLTRGTLHFIPNAAPSASLVSGARDIDFIWVNRLIPQRRSDWFVDALNDPSLRQCTAAILGFERAPAGSEVAATQSYVQSKLRKGVETVGFVNPIDHYARARFFILPTTIVFGNNALLEAMAHGVVPIVSGTDATALIVEDGVSGIVCEHSARGLLEGMRRASRLSSSEWTVLSIGARSHVEKRHGLRRWTDKMVMMYREVAER